LILGVTWKTSRNCSTGKASLIVVISSINYEIVYLTAALTHSCTCQQTRWTASNGFRGLISYLTIE
jgi:hypothetical protein